MSETQPSTFAYLFQLPLELQCLIFETVLQGMTLQQALQLRTVCRSLSHLLVHSKLLSRVQPHRLLENTTKEGRVEYTNESSLLRQHFPHVPYTMNLVVSRATDLSALSCLYKVEILCNEKLVDLSPLRGVHTVLLAHCPMLSDLSPLCQAQDVGLDSCNGITDVSPLASVHKLYLNDCTNIQTVASLYQVHTLCIMGCKHITDTDALTNVHTLSLSQCFIPRDLSCFTQVHSLKLHVFRKSVGASRPLSIQKLELEWGCCQWLEPFSTVSELRLSCGILHPEELRHLTRISTLRLKDRNTRESGLPLLSDLSPLSQARSLCLVEFHHLVDVSPLCRVQELILHSCSALVDVSALHTVPCLVLWHCDSVATVSTLDAVPKLIVHGCKHCPDVWRSTEPQQCFDYTNCGQCSLKHLRDIAGC